MLFYSSFISHRIAGGKLLNIVGVDKQLCWSDLRRRDQYVMILYMAPCFTRSSYRICIIYVQPSLATSSLLRSSTSVSALCSRSRGRY